jgi:hypothetical protein
MQTTSQSPQFDVSFAVSTQEAPQVVFAPQVFMHTPPWQTLPFGHAVPQSPQCAGSELSSTHLPLQLL